MSSRIRSIATALAVVASLSLLPALEAGSLTRARWEGPAVAQRHGDRSFAQAFWSLLTSLWGKSGSKIDGNG